ncbi:unnamed protein product [Heligmosomoides polygyrus]|uniref:SH2 domain-containing protein n=1 Tax=Heligmosomoides polygyrus TaxID=6339 RepID=A0A3P8A8Y5_HELPZ|nr:unnamed protein product [Heligmosomoides polygyrus]
MELRNEHTLSLVASDQNSCSRQDSNPHLGSDATPYTRAVRSNGTPTISLAVTDQHSPAANAVKPDDFAIYYRKNHHSDVSTTIPLFLVHRNTQNEVYHFPVLRCIEENGSKWWFVQIGNNKMQSFRQLSDLVRCYHLYRFTDARTGRMEVFPLWPTKPSISQRSMKL